MQSVGVVALSVGGVLIEPGGLSDAFCQIFCEVSDVATCFLGATEDALDVYLRPEVDNVRGFGEVCTGLFPGR